MGEAELNSYCVSSIYWVLDFVHMSPLALQTDPGLTYYPYSTDRETEA